MQAGSPEFALVSSRESGTLFLNDSVSSSQRIPSEHEITGRLFRYRIKIANMALEAMSSVVERLFISLILKIP